MDVRWVMQRTHEIGNGIVFKTISDIAMLKCKGLISNGQLFPLEPIELILPSIPQIPCPSGVLMQ